MAQEEVLADLNFRHLTVKQGLPSNHVTCFKKDPQGFMWVGTKNGLARWDGSNVKVFKNNPSDSTTISGNYIKDIVFEGDSVLWVATAKDGLNKYNLNTEVFTRYYPNPTVKGSIPNEEVHGLGIDSFGQLWVGFHRAGFCKYVRETDSFEKIGLPSFSTLYRKRSNSIIKKFLFDDENPHVVWMFTIEDLLKYNDETKEFNVYPYINTKGDTINTGVGYGIKGLDGKLYIPTYQKGVTVFDPVTEIWHNYDEINHNPLDNTQNRFSKIEQIDEYTFWLGSYVRGMAFLDTRKGYIELLSVCSDGELEGDCSIRVNCMDMDAEDGHWIGTNSGLRYYSKQGNQFDVYSHEVDNEDLKGRESISTICQMEQNGIYFGGYAGEGVYYFDFTSKKESLISPPKRYQPGEELEMFHLRDLLPYNDTVLLVLSNSALFTLNIATNKLVEVPIDLEFDKDYLHFHRILKHSSGQFYISSRHNGICILDSKLKVIDQIIQSPTDESGISSSNYIYEITEDPDGKVWIGREDGFTSYDPKTEEYLNSDYFERLDSATQLKVVFKIKCAPDSSLWFADARSYGVSLDYPYSKPFVFKPILTGKDSLAERLLNFQFLRNGSTIITSTGGLSIFAKDGSIRRYNNLQGLPSLSGLRPIVELLDGRIAMGYKSLIFFHPDSLKAPPTNLPVYLSSIRVFNEEFNFDHNDVLKSGIKLSYLENFFEIGVGLINYDDPENYTLSYRLKGLNDEWINSSSKNAVFTNIPGGDYVFEARFVNQNEEVLKQHISIPIEIVPQFWKTWWFKSVLGCFFILIGLGFYAIRIRSMERENALKIEFNKQLANMELSTLRSQMNPHFIFNSLNSIRYKIMSNKPAEADKYLVKFSRLIRHVLQNSRENLINLGKEIETLKLYMELESSRFEHRFSYEVKVGEDIQIDELKIPPLLLQPYVENAIWHGLMQKEGAGKVLISISQRGKCLELNIEDNGVGRQRAKELKSKTAISRQSLGIGITGSRLEIIEKLYQIHCKSEITDLVDSDGVAQGTRVTLIIPLIYES